MAPKCPGCGKCELDITTLEKYENYEDNSGRETAVVINLLCWDCAESDEWGEESDDVMEVYMERIQVLQNEMVALLKQNIKKE